jgi:hypothetical protein
MNEVSHTRPSEHSLGSPVIVKTVEDGTIVLSWFDPLRDDHLRLVIDKDSAYIAYDDELPCVMKTYPAPEGTPAYDGLVSEFTMLCTEKHEKVEADFSNRAGDTAMTVTPATTDYLMFWCTEGSDSLRKRSFLFIRGAMSEADACVRADAAEGVPDCWAVLVKGENLQMTAEGLEAVSTVWEEAEYAKQRVCIFDTLP